MSGSGRENDVRWRLLTPSRPGAIAIIELLGESASETDEALARIGAPDIRTGDVELRTIAGVDRGLVVRWSGVMVHLMPHGGAAVVRALIQALSDVGIKRYRESAMGREGRDANPHSYPETSNEVESLMLVALSRAQSPLAVDLLLAQPERWRGRDGSALAPAELGRLIEPPLVVVRGEANVGKSTLVNALAGRAVSVVADEPGTTRDHVGVMVNMAGLVVRLLDLPGQRQGAPQIERDAMMLASELAEGADLSLQCGDREHRPAGGSAQPPLEESTGQGIEMEVSLKADLGACSWRADHHVSAHTGQGMAELVAGVREHLVPAKTLADPRPWRFWGSE